MLVLIHGTFSSTDGTFGKLWTDHPKRVELLFGRYDRRVYALDHATLGASPIGNALMLVQALPAGARLHLLTHSRGGLVAEVLARACAQPQPGSDDLAFFEGGAYAGQRAELSALTELVRTKGIRVERVVRVACPARGTLLASKRLDAYLSVFKWTLELAGLIVAPALLELLGEIAQRRTDPAEIPGLAAQLPDSPLVRWLHAVDAPIAGDLRVVAGDLQGDSVTSWLKTLLADAFYWTDNDLIVQTRSMYGGAPRAAGASFLLDRGGEVSHFSYFANPRTAEAIVDALVHDEVPQGFGVIGPLSWAGESATGTRGRSRGAAETVLASELPAVFVLPGILGSNLKVDGKRIWLGWRMLGGLGRLVYTGKPDGVEPDGPIGSSYDRLAAFLAASHEVIEFGFDWRKPIEEEARRLGTAVDAALSARERSGQPVRLLAHSMGGILARTMQLERPDVWDRMMLRPGARLLMLGTPNGGSWAPMQVLSGDDTFGNTLVAFGAPFQDHQARDLMAQFPGFIQLQAGLRDAARGLGVAKTWQDLAQRDLEMVRRHNVWHDEAIQLNPYTWGVPSQAVLDSALALRKRLDAQRDGGFAASSDKLLLVVGNAKFTPDGYEIGDEGLVYLDAANHGDGRVTLDSALLPGVRTWRLDCEHGSLPDQRAAFGAYLELLQSGSTTLLEVQRTGGSSRGAGDAAPAAISHVRSRPARARLAAPPPEAMQDVLATSPREADTAPERGATKMRVTVVNGDLTFVRQPLLLGHYRSLRLTGSEAVVNRLIGGAMAESMNTGLYPIEPGSHQMFINSTRAEDNPWRLPRPEAVIVVGLGQEGKLRASDLAQSVQQAVLAWAQRAAEAPASTGQFDLAATLLGSGGPGISAGQAAQLIAQGVREANLRLGRSNSGWPTVGRLFLVELYLDRATEAWRALKVHIEASPDHYVVDDTLQFGPGALRRPLDSGYRGADYDLISAISGIDADGDAMISFTLDTKRARTELRSQRTQSRLLRMLVAQACNDANHDAQIGRTLFQLLVPIELEGFLGGTTEMQIEVDSGTAGIPWELLDAPGADTERQPWAIRAKLLRKLRTDKFRAQVRDAEADASVLVIGEPACDNTIYPRLPGAREEARAVVERLLAPGALDADSVRALPAPDDDSDRPGPDASAVINALLEQDWRIVHIAGHGEPPEKLGPVPRKPGDPPQKNGDPRGVVLSDGTFLGWREICNMRVVPELVFVNCCHLAAFTSDQLLRGRDSGLAAGFDRPSFAAGVAEALIGIGVRCVVAAGWAVEDAPAMRFATTFYDALLRGRRFLDAVAEARLAAFERNSNTWAAYQCYGDPDWTLRRRSGDAQRVQTGKSPGEEFAAVASPPALALALETLAIQSQFQQASAQEQKAKIRHLEARFGTRWGGIGAVAEAFGVACAAARDIAAAVGWYQRAVAANDGSASIKCAEQLGNLRVRLAWEEVDRALQKTDKLQRQTAQAGGAAAGGDLQQRLATAQAEVVAVASAAEQPLADALAQLERLAQLQPSIERESLCGSACKRRAMVARTLGRGDEEVLAAVRAARAHYHSAYLLARDTNDPGLFYPALNVLAADLVTGALPLDPELMATSQTQLASRVRDDPDFWSVAAQIELRLHAALQDRRLSSEDGKSLRLAFDDLHARVAAPWLWASVYDQARFVLAGYAASSPPGVEAETQTEARAAAALLDQLAGFAEAGV